MNLAKVIFMLKHSVKLCRRMLHHMPHHQITYDDVILSSFFNKNINLARFSTSSLMMVVDRNM